MHPGMKLTLLQSHSYDPIGTEYNFTADGTWQPNMPVGATFLLRVISAGAQGLDAVLAVSAGDGGGSGAYASGIFTLVAGVYVIGIDSGLPNVADPDSNPLIACENATPSNGGVVDVNTGASQINFDGVKSGGLGFVAATGGGGGGAGAPGRITTGGDGVDGTNTDGGAGGNPGDENGDGQSISGGGGTGGRGNFDPLINGLPGANWGGGGGGGGLNGAAVGLGGAKGPALIRMKRLT